MREPKWLTDYWDTFFDLVSERTASLWELYLGGTLITILLLYSAEFVAEISAAATEANGICPIDARITKYAGVEREG
jgi:hypothetical protein